MTPERWREIEELYHSGRERGIGVLEGTDPELRREVERLLALESDGRMAFHEGIALRERIASQPMPVQEALQIAGGLAKAHEHGLPSGY